MHLIHISLGGRDCRLRLPNGSVVLFEDHPIFGPLALNRDGSVKERQPGDRSLFWKIHRYWSTQGKAIDNNGIGIWEAPKAIKVVRMFGNQYRLARNDELHVAEDYFDDN